VKFAYRRISPKPHARGSEAAMFIAEQFRFAGKTLVEVRVHVRDPPQ
jgi:hypothetical protein